MATKAQINRVKDIDMVELIMHSGIRYSRGRGHVKIGCVFHGPERTPSLTVYHDHFYCFGCQSKGDVITLAQELWDVPFGDAVKILIDYMDENNL